MSDKDLETGRSQDEEDKRLKNSETCDNLHGLRGMLLNSQNSSNHLIRSLLVSRRVGSKPSHLIRYMNLERCTPSKSDGYLRNSGWDVHLKLCQLVKARHRWPKAEAVLTARVRAQAVHFPLLSESSETHNSRGRVPDLTARVQAQGFRFLPFLLEFLETHNSRGRVPDLLPRRGKQKGYL